MQIIGFNLTKILAEKNKERITTKPSNSIEFTNLEKEKINVLKDNEALKVSFKYSIDYEESEKKDSKEGSILFNGMILVSVSKEESREITKAWKKKQLPPNTNIFLFKEMHAQSNNVRR